MGPSLVGMILHKCLYGGAFHLWRELKTQGIFMSPDKFLDNPVRDLFLILLSC